MVPRRPSSWLAAACLLLSLQSVSFVAAVNYRHCSDKPLETREEEANVIFTGTIRNLYTDWDRPRLKRAQVEVKRVMKGRNVINKLPGAWPGNFWHRRIVTVDGIGDPHICDSRVRKYDTRIFMLGRGEHGELRLNSSLIRITLDNIKEADAAVRDIPFSRQSKLPVAACSSEYCAFGAECFLDDTSQKALCRCLERCSGAAFAPVCGSDDVTYSSECHLRKESCKRQTRIVVAFTGSCGSAVTSNSSDVKDPCSTRKCRHGATCVVSLDGRRGRCECPQRCDGYGNSRGSRPVCGSDGRDYASMCDMRRRACQEAKDVRVKYMGKCDPCQTFYCPLTQSCQLDEAREPVCRCDLVCALDYVPVCGSDGQSYVNECIMRETACKARTEIRVLFNGECSAADNADIIVSDVASINIGRNPCARLSCADGESCHVNRAGRPHCACPPPCERVVSPVCGSDGRTYDSQCALRRVACFSKQRLTVQAQRECSNNGPCSKHRCYYGAICVVKGDAATCECPECQDNMKPVCGSDGVTYDNGCKLQVENCRLHRNVTVKHMGQCNDCATTRCKHYAICEGDETTGTQCVCPRQCVHVEKKVCGSDGVTYTNECELQVRSCNNKQTITVVSHGPCGLCADVRCQFSARCTDGVCMCAETCPPSRQPVCGDDGTTYDSVCHLQRQACRAKVDIAVAHGAECQEFSGSGDDGSAAGMITDDDAADGKCDDASCRFGGNCVNGKCACHFTCNAVRSAVCGSDGRTHGSKCLMLEEACRTQQPISDQSMDNCEDFTVEHCDGRPPLIDPRSGQHYMCAEGRDTCPAGSYCHTVNGASKCCREDQPIKGCSDSPFGCCPDQKTLARGANGKGCPGICRCNHLGSNALTCDPQNHQCSCKPGVGGLRCDRCEPGFWGLHQIAEGNTGCIPCGCDLHGSVRDDCEQMTGHCVCKEGIRGQKCHICANGKLLANDCTGDRVAAKSCAEKRCQHGARCKMVRGVAECVCGGADDCEPRADRVCGTDGVTYASTCQLAAFACRLEADISVAHKGRCKGRGRTAKSGQLGASCDSQSECSATHSACRHGSCVCRRGYVVSQNGLSCGEALNTTSSEMSNDFDPHNAMLGDQRDTSSRGEYTVAGFNGAAYLRLKTVRHASREMAIAVTFRALNPDGVIFYSAQHSDRPGDFISLTLRDGYVEFRYDLGSGPLILRWPHKVTMNTYHEVVARRVGRDGTLVVDGGVRRGGGVRVAGVSQGDLQSLDLAQPFYLGGVAKVTAEMKQSIGIDVGFVGCIKKLEITTTDDATTYDLVHPGSRDVIDASGIEQCADNACSGHPCLNGGHCTYKGVTPTCQCKKGYSGARCEFRAIASALTDACNPNPCEGGGVCSLAPSGGRFVCRCRGARQGQRCEQVVTGEITVPAFDGDSYLQLKINHNVATSLNYQIWFYATKPDGLLLYGSQPRKAGDRHVGDFVSLNLVDRHLQFRYDLGSGIANITSRYPITLNMWHEVEITRSHRQGTLVVDGEKPAHGKSQGGLNNLNLGPTIYLGGYPGTPKSTAGITGGFHGAIQRVYESRQLLEPLVGGAVGSRGMRQHDGAPCHTGGRHQCLNGGTCTAHLNDFLCKCADGFSGKNCEIVGAPVAVRKRGAVAFNGVVYYQYMNKITDKQRGQKSNRLEVRFRTRSPDGLLLLQQKSSTVPGDYLAIALRGGRAEVTYNLGKEKSPNSLLMRSEVRLDDGNWHVVSFSREKRKGELYVDAEPPVSIVSQPGATSLDTDGYLWLGGSRSVPAGLPEAYSRPFEGCIASLLVNKQPMDLFENRVAPTRIEFCDGL